jgi:hypothetical protein
MPKLEDFQRGVPLNDELRRLKDGLESAEEPYPPPQGGWEIDQPERELTQDEREDLARLVREPGWRVLLRLRKRTLRRMEQAAIVASQVNPLGRAQEIAVGWANLEAFRAQANLDQAGVEAEIQALESE